MSIRIQQSKTLSKWGEKVIWLNKTARLSYRDMERESGLPHEQIWKMSHDPNFDPKYNAGIKILSMYYRVRRRFLQNQAPQASVTQS